jgi:hypothetical protein
VSQPALSPSEYGRYLGERDRRPLTEVQVEAAARILAGAGETADEVAAA